MVLNIDSVMQSGEYKGKTVREILELGKKEIFTLIRNGVSFDDEVLSLAGIRKSVRDVKIEQRCVEHEKDTKTYEKEKDSLSKILKEIRTLDNIQDIDNCPESDINEQLSSKNDIPDEENDNFEDIEF